jgi:hypothetical protein
MVQDHPFGGTARGDARVREHLVEALLHAGYTLRR